MFGKLIAWGGDREEAIDRMLGALSEMEIVGIKHNISFHQCVLNDPKFKAGEYGTSFCSGWQQDWRQTGNCQTLGDLL